ncbi:xanthine dehydrogenase accessory protein XdhC [Aquitalea sp.]|jgi:xanthine dehydrogenase accessory factor|uniref:xanthine dehydrogenase accessory protein XdhC n=1 Tax=Aquitalea sp. TaxID=1872623 RepID=UPI0025832B19|nr:xanthine dehydrogenase accessory protein XdhC [Aquitalea sp.]
MLLDGDWLSVLRQQLALQKAAILITLVRSQGHVPREVGARMAVGCDWSADTLGDGWLEIQAGLRARQLLSLPVFLRCCERFDLGNCEDCCCTGSAWLLFELLNERDLPWLEMAWLAGAQGRVLRRLVTLESDAPVEYYLLPGRGSGIRQLEPSIWQDDLPVPAMRVVLCGAGHIGRAVSRLLGDLPYTVFWLDSRPEFLPAELPANTTGIVGAVEKMDSLPADACWLVMTHSDQLDFDWIEQILLRNDARFIGLLGCRSKLASFNLRLINRVPLGRIASIHCLGTEGMQSRPAAAIAIAVVAELLQQLQPG